MSVTVLLPSSMRPFAGGQHAVQSDGGTVGAVLAAMLKAHPALRGHVLAADGRLPPFVRVFVGGKDVAGLAGLDTPVPDGGEVLILQAISGG